MPPDPAASAALLFNAIIADPKKRINAFDRSELDGFVRNRGDFIEKTPFVDRQKAFFGTMCSASAKRDASCGRDVWLRLAFHSVADIDIDAHNNPLLFLPDGFSMKFALAGIMAYRRAQCPHF